jgi:hypothetical protein
MNTRTIKGKSLGILLSLALVLSLVAVVLPAPVKAAVTVVAVTSPTTGSPAYSKTGGTPPITFSVTTDVGVLGDISIKILNAGTTTVAASKDVQYSFALGANAGLNWTVTLTGVASGTYDVQVSAREPAGTGTWIDSAVQSNALIVDNTAPVVTLTQPNGGEYVKSDAAYTIAWNATDALPAVSTVTVTAEQSTDGGTTWAATDITGVSKIKGVNSAAWGAASIPNIDSQLARIRLTVTDASGNSTVVPSASNFTILNTAPVVSISIPSASTSWNGGSNQNITFTTTSAFNLNVDYMLEFSTDGATWSTITDYVTNQPVGLTTYPWTVNNAYRGAAARIRATVRDKVLRTGTTTSGLFTILDVTAPTVTVTAPAAGAKLYNGVASSITWTANDNVAGVNLTYNWYYSTDGGSSWAFISSSTEAQGTITKAWTPTGITTTQANCKVKVEATDAATTPNTGTGYSGTFSIYLATAPTVTVSAPATAASWQVGTCHAINWTTTYTPDPAALLTITIALSADSGGTYPTTIVTLPNQSVGSGSFNWAVAGAPLTTYRIRVTATDPAALSGNGESGIFTTTTADAGLVTSPVITIAAGWNLVSLPIIPTCTSVESVLAGTAGTLTPYVNSVWYFTGGPSGTWQSWAPGAPSSLTTMEAGKAYWVNIAGGAPANFTFQGRKCASGIGPPPSYSTVAGWNMVGFKSTIVKTIDLYLGTCPSTSYLTPVYEYTGGAYVPINCLGNMTVSKGYWVYYSTAGTIFPGCD